MFYFFQVLNNNFWNLKFQFFRFSALAGQSRQAAHSIFSATFEEEALEKNPEAYQKITSTITGKLVQAILVLLVVAVFVATPMFCDISWNIVGLQLDYRDAQVRKDFPLGSSKYPIKQMIFKPKTEKHPDNHWPFENLKQEITWRGILRSPISAATLFTRAPKAGARFWEFFGGANFGNS